ncbi:MAG: NAD(P)H-dependent glycerol-3-phosphate dehydrogenase [Bacteroidetes bacterium]|nr:NAD(P)H-dependent glycerol-3-phosphate dehydrogenase [Bacteroidota bacterium]
MDTKENYAVIGSGSWATALVKILQNNVDCVNWWVRESEVKEGVEKYHHNPLYLSSVELDSQKLNISNDIYEIINNATCLIFAIPAAFMYDALSELPKEIFKNKKIFSATKGIIPSHNLIIADFFNQNFGIPFQYIGIISGPSHAEEIALEKLTYLTVASQNNELAEFMADCLRCRYVKTSTSDDIYGTEYAAVLKNIYAIAAGVCKGLGYGDNFLAVLISNALQEMEKFIENVHPINRELTNSVYLGDLMVTAYSQFSRNRTFGTMIGSGYSVKSAQLEMKMIAEGYYAANCIHIINEKYQVEMPIMDAMYNILYENISPFIEIKILSDRMK